MAPELRERLEALWSQPGGVSFRAYMEAALYGPGGYYMESRKKTGPDMDADFATSPTMHPFFGEAIGRELASWWKQMGSPDPFVVCEFGGGEGDLARNAQAALRAENVPVAWRNVEISPFHQEKQGMQVASADGAHAVVAHEFLDALPFRWMECEDEWKEWFVENGELDLRPADCPLPALDGLSYAWMTGIGEWIATLPPCRALVVDYGGRFEELTHKNPVRAYKQHQHADLLEPGVDITASVDFTHVAQLAKELRYETQESFLIRNGIFEAIQNHPQQTLEDMSQFMRLKQLLNPATFGAFKVASYQIG